MGTDIYIFIAMVFLAVFFLVTALVVPAFGTSAKNARLIRKRAKHTASELHGDSLSILKELRGRKESAFEKSTKKFRLIQNIDTLLEQTGSKTPAYQYILFILFVSVLAGLATFYFLKLIIAASIAFFIPIAISWFNVQNKLNRRIVEFESQLPDALNIIARALRAGHPFNAALKLLSEEMSEPIGGEFKIVASDISCGVDTRVALLDLIRRVPSVSLNAVVTAVIIQKESGGNLAEILDKVAAVVRGRFRFARKVKTMSAEGRMSAWVLTGVPFILAGVLAMIEPTYLPYMTKEPAGRQLILIGFMAIIAGMLWMRKIIKIDV